MTLVNHDTGEITETLTEDAARRLTDRIRLLADTLADTLDKMADLIDQARTGSAWLALGYRSWTEYVATEFAGVLPRLEREPRQEFVRELSARGMSTRAIAPIVGVGDSTVQRDIAAAPHGAPETPEGGATDARRQQAAVEAAPSVPRPPVTAVRDRSNVVGLDGKRYSSPPPRPTRSPEQQNAEEFAVRFAGQIFSLQSMQHGHMRAAAIKEWRVGQTAVSPIQKPYASPERIRAAAKGLLALADEWEQSND